VWRRGAPDEACSWPCTGNLTGLVAPPAAAAAELPPLARHSDTFLAGQVGPDERGLAASTQPDVAIVRYAGPISSAQRQALRASGLRILEYIPPHAYLVRNERGPGVTAADLPGVAAVLSLRRADKLAPSLLRAAQRGDGAGEPLLAWRFDGTAVELPMAPRRFADWLALADDPSIRWLEPASRPRLLSDHARQIVGADSIWLPAGLFGEGQVVAVLDSGLDTGDAGTLSLDLSGRVTAALPASPSGTQEIPYALPNTVAGWGRLDLRPLVAAPPAVIWYDDHSSGLGTGSVVSYVDDVATPLVVVDGSQPLVVTLAWTDPPASLSAATTLVNDLDLEVVGPGGSYFGNGMATGDRLNNVEGVIVTNPPPGAYSVTVRAFNVPIASQPYALVVRGGLVSDVIFADGFENGP
jgi:hypothetical protein